MKNYTNTESLVDDVRRGKTEAFEFLFKTYYPRLRLFASHFLNDFDEAADVVQETFIKMWERREQLTYVSLSALLFTMVRNGCLNRLKHELVANDYQVDYLAHLAGDEQLYYTTFLNEADHSLLVEDLRKQVERVLATLPPRSSEIFKMSRYEGMKNREIAEQLHISVKVVERHISRALAAFRKQRAAFVPLEK